MRLVAKILAYDGATELGLGRDSTGEHWIFEGPVLDGKPYRWIKQGTITDLSAQYPEMIRQARRAL